MAIAYERNVELQATCSALGYLEKGTYYKEPDCLGIVIYQLFYLRNPDMLLNLISIIDLRLEFDVN